MLADRAGEALVIRCLPASGKTYLARRLPMMFADVDDLMYSTFNEKPSPALVSRLSSVDVMQEKMRRSVDGALRSGRIALFNFDPSLIGLDCDLNLAYVPDNYIDHITLAGRRQLIERFGLKTLRSWAKGYYSLPNVVWMQPAEYIADYVLSDEGRSILAKSKPEVEAP